MNRIEVAHSTAGVCTARHGYGFVRTRQSQRGVALAISLVLLIAMTIVGIATLSGTRLNEKVASNAQQKSVAFEVAESAINTVWNMDEIFASIEAIPEADYAAPPDYVPPGVAAALLVDFDQTSDAKTVVDIAGEVLIRFCGESKALVANGTEVNAGQALATGFAPVLFDVAGVATINNSAASAEHVQRGAVSLPVTGRGGACVSPGL